MERFWKWCVSIFIFLIQHEKVFPIFLSLFCNFCPLLAVNDWELKLETLSKKMGSLKFQDEITKTEIINLKDHIEALEGRKAFFQDAIQKEQQKGKIGSNQPPFFYTPDPKNILEIQVLEKRLNALSQKISVPSYLPESSKIRNYLDLLTLQRDFLLQESANSREEFLQFNIYLRTSQLPSSYSVSSHIQDRKRRTPLGILKDPSYTTNSTQVLLPLHHASRMLPAPPSLSSSSPLFLPSVSDDAFKRYLDKSLTFKTLDLTGCTQITDLSIRLIAKKLTQLQELTLSGCTQVTSSTVEFLAERLKSSLKKIDLRGVPDIPRDIFVKLQETGIAFRPEMALIETLDYRNQPVDDSDLIENLENYLNIRALNLSGCRFITGDGLKHSATLKNLEILNLSGCTQITDTSINFVLDKATGLKRLTLDGVPGVELETLRKILRESKIEFSSKGIIFNECLSTLNGHSSVVLSIIQLADGRLASGSLDRTIRLWNVRSDQCEAILQGDSSTLLGLFEGVSSVLQLQDGRLASGSLEDKSIKFWNLTTGQCTTKLKVGYRVCALIQLSDRRLAVGGGSLIFPPSGKISLWDIENNKRTAILDGHTECINSLIQLNNGLLVSGSSDKTIKFWDMGSAKCISTLTGHIDGINVLIQLKNELLASASNDKTIKLWNVNGGQCVGTLSGHEDRVESLIQLSDERLASGSAEDGIIKLWTQSEEGITCVATLSTGFPVYYLTQLNNGLLASVGGSVAIKTKDRTGCIKLWSV